MSPVTFKDILLFTHATFGMLGVLGALWVFVETLNAHEGNLGRIRLAAGITTFFLCVAWVCGGYWYVNFYPVDKAIILKGPWPFAHSFFMETKEHLFFITLILAFYLPVAVRDALDVNTVARRMVLTVAALIVLTAFSIEGFGAGISYGVKMAFMRPVAPVTPAAPVAHQ
jgi:hypothetical protein